MLFSWLGNYLSFSQSLLFRVRKLHPCIISNISFDIDLPEDDEIQVDEDKAKPLPLFQFLDHIDFLCVKIEWHNNRK